MYFRTIQYFWAERGIAGRRFRRFQRYRAKFGALDSGLLFTILAKIKIHWSPGSELHCTFQKRTGVHRERDFRGRCNRKIEAGEFLFETTRNKMELTRSGVNTIKTESPNHYHLAERTGIHEQLSFFFPSENQEFQILAVYKLRNIGL